MTQRCIGRYEVEKELGAGAMAVVYKAVDPLIGRTVAIKTIKFDSSFGVERAELRERLYREAQSAGNLNHPNIVTIYDIGEEADVSYIAMEFIEGESLQEWMAANQVPPVEQTASIIEQIASGLDYAASRGIIHRDVKPANILLTSDLKAKIADFGIAKFSTSKFTQTGAIIGTPAYMSPEQAMGKTLDGRSDIFSLGVIFYEMLTGEKPFSGSNPTTIMYKILHEDPVPPRRLNITLHPAFDTIVARMLAKDPDQRYQSCAELIRDLKNYPSLEVKPAAVSGKRGRRTGTAALVIVLLAAIGAGGYFYYQYYLRPAQAPPPARIQAKTAPPPVKNEQVATTAALPQSPAPLKEAAKVAEAPVTEKKEQIAELKTFDKPDKKESAAVDKPIPSKPKQPPVVEKPGRAEVRFEFAGVDYPVALFDGAKKLQDLSFTASSLEVPAGEHRFRLVSEAVFLDRQLAPVKLKTDEVYTIPIPGLCSAYIEVPNDAYDGCEIHLNGRQLSPPYPAQIPKLASGDNRIVFRWTSGKYAGKEITSVFSSEANHHFRIRGEPQTDQVTVQRIR